MQPYVIKQGDFLAKLAYRFGFDAGTVWSDPKNAELRQLRPNPNILWPTDILYIPDQIGKKLPKYDLVMGTTNTFVVDVPTVTLKIKFTDRRLASRPYSIQELPELAGTMSGADGMVSFAVPVTLATATIVFTDSRATFVYKMGHLDPIDTLSGVFQRLQNLGFIDASVPVSSATAELVRWALLSFKEAEAQGSTPSEASPPPSMLPPSSPPPSSAPSTPAPSSTAMPRAGSEPSPALSGPASGDAHSASAPPSPGAMPALSPNPSQPLIDGSEPQPPPDSGPVASENGGLNDDGTLDEETRQLLLSAHGS